jgi:hypothetical protein
VRSFLRARAFWAAVFAVAAVVLRTAAPSPPPCTVEGVAAMLGAAVGGEVRPDDFVWEARGGFLADTFLGRQVLFLARANGSAPADLYRARVRLTRAGRPVSVGAVRNLTRSPLGDDRDLVAQGHHAAYVTTAFGVVRGVTLLDLDGDRGAHGALAGVAQWLATGSTRGIGRTEITFGAPPSEAREELQGDLLVMALGKEAVPAALDLGDGGLNTGAENTFLAAPQRLQAARPALSDVAARAAKELAGDGAARAVRGLADALDAAAARSGRQERSSTATSGGPPPPPDAGAFPPPAIAPAIAPPLPGEGAWTSANAAAGDAQPCLYETVLRPNPQAPEAVVRMVALDTRQIDLWLSPGVDEPRSQTGLHGRGRPPLHMNVDRVVAAFTAGPAERRLPEDEGAVVPGFVADTADGRVFALPVRGLATVALEGDGRVEVGPWPFGSEVPSRFTSLRQALDPRTHGGEARTRSALGLLPSGHLVYAWSLRARWEPLARALTLAGCTSVVPLAAEPAPSGLAFLRKAESPRALDPAMPLGFDWLAGPTENDVLWAVLRDTAPPSAALTPDGGRQPSPAWLPSIHAGVVTSLGAQVHVTTFAPGRVALTLRAGAREPATKAVAALPAAISDAEQPRLLAAIGVGTGKRHGAFGLVVDGAMGLPPRLGEGGMLVLDHGRPRIVLGAEVVAAPGVDAVELPLTADDGELRAEARGVNQMRARAVACVLADGTFAVAATTFDSDEAATAVLLGLGCRRVVALDRGSHQSAFVHRAGTPTPPELHYEASAIYALEVPLSGRAAPLAAP